MEQLGDNNESSQERDFAWEERVDIKVQVQVLGMTICHYCKVLFHAHAHIHLQPPSRTV